MVICYWLLSFRLLSMHFGLLLEKCQKKVWVGLRFFLTNMHAKVLNSTHFWVISVILVHAIVESSTLVSAPIMMLFMSMLSQDKRRKSLAYIVKEREQYAMSCSAAQSESAYLSIESIFTLRKYVGQE